uniref:Uncharacterized protein n=1 Tax=Strigamia maritima TaxID=126957 RepID=T1IKP5_STRMM
MQFQMNKLCKVETNLVQAGLFVIAGPTVCAGATMHIKPTILSGCGHGFCRVWKESERGVDGFPLFRVAVIIVTAARLRDSLVVIHCDVWCGIQPHDYHFIIITCSQVLHSFTLKLIKSKLKEQMMFTINLQIAICLLLLLLYCILLAKGGRTVPEAFWSDLKFNLEQSRDIFLTTQICPSGSSQDYSCSTW